jgi:hypothetical protein
LPGCQVDLDNAKGKGAHAARLSHKHSKTVNELEVSGGGVTKVLGHRAFNKYYRQSLRPEREVNREGTRKIVALIGGCYEARGACVRFQGSARKAKAERQFEKYDQRKDFKKVLGMQIHRNKFHRVRREDYHA